MVDVHTLGQACGLTLIRELSLTTAMITRSRASYVSALDPGCPVKCDEPVKNDRQLMRLVVWMLQVCRYG